MQIIFFIKNLSDYSKETLTTQFNKIWVIISMEIITFIIDLAKRTGGGGGQRGGGEGA